MQRFIITGGVIRPSAADPGLDAHEQVQAILGRIMPSTENYAGHTEGYASITIPEESAYVLLLDDNGSALVVDYNGVHSKVTLRGNHWKKLPVEKADTINIRTPQSVTQYEFKARPLNRLEKTVFGD